MKRLLLSLAILLSCLSQTGARNLAGSKGAPPAPALFEAGTYVPGQLVVGRDQQVKAASLNLPEGVALAQSSSLLDRLNISIVSVPVGQEEEIRSQLLGEEGVIFAEPNYYLQAELIPDDPLWLPGFYSADGQYGPQHVNAPAAWELTQGSSEVIVAILDSGISLTHPEFSGRLLPGYDFVEKDNTPQDDYGHGTHVAGIIAANGNNAKGIAGIDWNAKILPVKVLNYNGSGTYADAASGLLWAVEQGADVINLSLGACASSSLLENATYYAYSHGAAVFSAAGNMPSLSCPTTDVLYPARYPWVMAVAASDQGDARISSSRYGPEVDLTAPGYNILSTVPINAYGLKSGTSMATPLVAGAAALLAGQALFDTPDKIYYALTHTAADITVSPATPGVDNYTGYGLLQIDRALAEDLSGFTPTPVPGANVEYDLVSSTRCSAETFAWVDAAAGSPIPLLGNDVSAALTLPFDFTFGGVNYPAGSGLTVSSNGYLTFGGTGTSPLNFTIPGVSQPNQMIAPFWDDLNPSAQSYPVAYALTTGAAPNRQWVIEWYRYPLQANPASDVTFEVVLYEGTNEIVFQYLNLNGSGSDGSSASIGLEYNDGLSGAQYAYNLVGAVKNEQAIRFIPAAAGSAHGVAGCTATIPYSSGQTRYESLPFCLTISPGSIPGSASPSVVIANFSSFNSSLGGGYTNLNRFADISLEPPVGQVISPRPRVCYHYSAGDLLKAGGNPANLFLAHYDEITRTWKKLSTTLDADAGQISAAAEHFSIFGVYSIKPKTMPVTGAPR